MKTFHLTDEIETQYVNLCVNSLNTFHSIAEEFQKNNCYNRDVVFIFNKSNEVISPTSLALDIDNLNPIRAIDKIQNYKFQLPGVVRIIKKAIDVTLSCSEVLSLLGYGDYTFKIDENNNYVNFTPFWTVFTNNKSPIEFIPINQLYNNITINTNTITQTFYKTYTQSMNKLNAINLQYYSKLTPYLFLIQNDLKLPTLMTDPKEKENFVQSKSYQKYNTTIKEFEYEIGRKTLKYFPYHFHRYLNHSTFMSIGKDIVKYHILSKSILMRLYLDCLKESHGLTDNCFWGKKLRNQKLISIGRDGVYTTTIDGKITRFIPITHVRRWELMGNFVTLDLGHFDEMGYRIEFDDNLKANDFHSAIQSVINELLRERDERLGNI